jgi:23S rRNA pseudouridine1911/1915/1917 synthase
LNLIILFEDNHLLAVFKPHGLLTQPSPFCLDSLENEAKAFIKERDKKKGGVFLHAIHRLDKEVSGIVLFAKTQKALERLNKAMREGLFEKEYLAIVQGKGRPPEGEIEHFLFHGDGKSYVVTKEHKEAKKAILHCTIVEQKNDLWTVKILLKTGRYHQIRSQLAACHFPIVGDKKYGSSLTYEKDGIALMHSKLSFPHPTKEEKVTIVTDGRV